MLKLYTQKQLQVRIETLFADVFGEDVSRGLLAKVVTGKVSAALQAP